MFLSLYMCHISPRFFVVGNHAVCTKATLRPCWSESTSSATQNKDLISPLRILMIEYGGRIGHPGGWKESRLSDCIAIQVSNEKLFFRIRINNDVVSSIDWHDRPEPSCPWSVCEDGPWKKTSSWEIWYVCGTKEHGTAGLTFLKQPFYHSFPGGFDGFPPQIRTPEVTPFKKFRS